MFTTDTIEINAENAPYAPEEYYGIYTIRRWTWYEKQVASSSATTVVDAVRGIANWSVPDWYTAMIKICVTPPEELLKKLTEASEDKSVEVWNEAVIQKLDADLGDLLRDKCARLMGIDKTGFLERSEQEKTILT